MQTYIYKSRKKDELYLYLSKKDDFSAVPPALFDAIGANPVFVMELTLTPERRLAREDVTVVIRHLQTQGFHVQMPPPVLNLQETREPGEHAN